MHMEKSEKTADTLITPKNRKNSQKQCTHHAQNRQ